MAFFKSLGNDSGVRDILSMNRAAGEALIKFHESVLRQDSELSAGEREMIAAYVSGLNDCQYCYGVHSVTAQAFGLAEAGFEKLLTDLDQAPVDETLKPILKFVRKLTLTPARMVQADADAVFAAGWSEQALNDAIFVACLFNFMNRLLEGHGVHGYAELYQQRGRALRDQGYSPLLAYLEIKSERKS